MRLPAQRGAEVHALAFRFAANINGGQDDTR